MRKTILILAAAATLFAGCKKDEDPKISINPQTLSFDGESSAQTITLTANTAWTATNSNDWLTVSPMSGTGDQTVKVTVIKNEGLDRTGTVTFSVTGLTQTLTIGQTGYPTLTASVASLDFGAQGGELEFTVSTNKDWTVSGKPDWATVAPAGGSASASGQAVKVSVPANSGVERVGTIVIAIDGSSVEIAVSQAGTAIEYGGVTYKTVTLKDGRTWMASPLKFIPEGKTPSDNPADGSGLWYPYTSDGTTCTPITDNPDGYLYDYPTAFGADITADNFKTFEGTRGICPEGWHIPTRTEFIDLVGHTVKGAEESDAPINTEAAYYDTDYNGAKVTALDADGFGWSFLGSINVANPGATASGSYQKLITESSVCSVEGYLGKNRLTYIICSTGNASAASTGNIQFFGLMSTFSKTYLEGRLNVAFANFRSGYEVRCIKDR